MQLKKTVVIGSGNVAEALVGALAGSGYELVQVASRNAVRGAHLALMGGCSHTADFTAIARADIYIVAVSDSAIGEVARRVDFGTGVVLHTAGSVHIDALAPLADRAVLYPLQTFTSGRAVDLRHVPLFIEAATPRALDAVQNLAQALSHSVRYTSSAQRAEVHLSAVFACNFSNYMYTAAQELLARHNMDFDLLKPLIAECARKAVEAPSPRLTQTGPAVRGDLVTQKKHLRMLGQGPLRRLYRIISKNIWETSRKR